MEQNVPLIWIILGAYVVPTIISAVNLISGFKKDKAQIKAGSDKTTLDWSRDIMVRLESVEEDLKISKIEIERLSKQNFEKDLEIAKLKILNVDQTARIVKLESEREELKDEVGRLRDRIKELEEENKRLKGEIKC